MISHERLDRLVGQILPARMARSIADVANRRTADELRRRGVHHRVRPGGVRPHPRARTSSPCRWVSTSTSSTPVGARRWCGSDGPAPTRPCWCTAAGCPSRSTPIAASIPLPRCVIPVSTRSLVVVGEGPMRARLERQAARLPVDFTGYIGCRDTVATILASADVALAPGPHETFGLAALEALASRHTRRRVANLGACRDSHHRQRSRPPTTTRTPSPAPSPLSSAGPSASVATVRADAPNSSPGPARPRACSTPSARDRAGPTTGHAGRCGDLRSNDAPAYCGSACCSGVSGSRSPVRQCRRRRAGPATVLVHVVVAASGAGVRCRPRHRDDDTSRMYCSLFSVLERGLPAAAGQRISPPMPAHPGTAYRAGVLRSPSARCNVCIHR